MNHYIPVFKKRWTDIKSGFVTNATAFLAYSGEQLKEFWKEKVFLTKISPLVHMAWNSTCLKLNLSSTLISAYIFQVSGNGISIHQVSQLRNVGANLEAFFSLPSHPATKSLNFFFPAISLNRFLQIQVFIIPPLSNYDLKILRYW